MKGIKNIFYVMFILFFAWLSAFTYFRWERLLRLEENCLQLWNLKPNEYKIERQFDLIRWCWHTTINTARKDIDGEFVYRDLVNFDDNLYIKNLIDNFKKEQKIPIITKYNFTFKK